MYFEIKTTWHRWNYRPLCHMLLNFRHMLSTLKDTVFIWAQFTLFVLFVLVIIFLLKSDLEHWNQLRLIVDSKLIQSSIWLLLDWLVCDSPCTCLHIIALCWIKWKWLFIPLLQIQPEVIIAIWVLWILFFVFWFKTSSSYWMRSVFGC